MQCITLAARPGLKLRASDGTEESGHPEMMSTTLFYRARPGDRLHLKDGAYHFNVATYAPEIDPRWMHTYAYAPDQSWTAYRHDLSAESYRQADYVFCDEVYFRVCLRKVNGGIFDGSEDINAILTFEAAPPVPYAAPAWLTAEAERVSARVHALRKPGTLVFALLTDTHYNVNGTWRDTAASIRALHGSLGLDGVIHLGDFTDGMVTADALRHYISIVMGDLNALGVPIWAALGNHDSNYFRGNPDRLSPQEQSALYLSGRAPRRAVDVDEQRLRLLFVDSFDPAEEMRYGYSPQCVEWLDASLNALPEGWHAVILSHLPPCARLQYWSKTLRGEGALRAALGRHAAKIRAWINGHNHADRLDNAEGFPIVSIGNAKCEAYFEHKTEGFVTPERRLGDASQELWDVLLVEPGDGALRFMRFGAGRDRIVKDGRVAWE